MFSILFKRIFRLSTLFSVFVLFALNFSINVSNAREKIVEMLVSNIGLESGSGVVRYNALTGEFMGSLDDPNEDFIRLPYDTKRRYDQPKGLAVDSDGQIYVAYRCSSCDNPQKGAILKFSMDSDGRMPTQRFAFGPGKEEGFEGLAISPDSQYLYVSQSESGRVIGYSAQGGVPQIKRTFTNFFHPRGLAFDLMGALYVLSEDNSFGGVGQISVVGKGAKPYLLVKPGPDSPLLLDDFSAGLTFGPMGDLFVVSTGRNMVLRYRILIESKVPIAKFVGEFADPKKNGCLDPAGLAFGPHDQNLYVTCRTSNNIVRYDGRTGKFIDEFVPGKNSNRFYKRFYKSRLNNPVNITFKSYDLPSPIRLKKPYNNEKTDPVTVFQWRPSENPEVDTYQLIIAKDPEMKELVLETELKIVPQVVIDFNEFELDFPIEVFWLVRSFDKLGNPIGDSGKHLCILRSDPGGFTPIGGLVTSDLTSLALSGAHVAVNTARHAQTENGDIDTASNGEYNITVRTIDQDGLEIQFPIEITATKKGFQPTKASLSRSAIQNNEITCNLVMTADSDGDGIPDAVENNPSSCLDANDADTDDDGIADGEEDMEGTHPCFPDTDSDGIQDGTELGLTLDDIGPDTDTAQFQPDIDPSTITNPLDDDSDNDGLSDGKEDANHNGSLDADETEPGFLKARALPAILPLLLGD